MRATPTLQANRAGAPSGLILLCNVSSRCALSMHVQFPAPNLEPSVSVYASKDCNLFKFMELVEQNTCHWLLGAGVWMVFICVGRITAAAVCISGRNDVA